MTMAEDQIIDTIISPDKTHEKENTVEHGHWNQFQDIQRENGGEAKQMNEQSCEPCLLNAKKGTVGVLV